MKHNQQPHAKLTNTVKSSLFEGLSEQESEQIKTSSNHKFLSRVITGSSSLQIDRLLRYWNFF